MRGRPAAEGQWLDGMTPWAFVRAMCFVEFLVQESSSFSFFPVSSFFLHLFSDGDGLPRRQPGGRARSQRRARGCSRCPRRGAAVPRRLMLPRRAVMFPGRMMWGLMCCLSGGVRTLRRRPSAVQCVYKERL